jgi:muramoyltetrapeptide carboxypeptidase
MIRPRAVLPGARIAIVAPASGCSHETVERGAAELTTLGFQPVVSDAVFARDLFSAGDAAVRAADFLRAWRDPSIAALVAVRGGYGSVHLLPRLPVDAIRETPKLFVGYSDNTSMLSWLTLTCGVTALHGPMLDGRLAEGPAGYDRRTFLAALRGEVGVPLAPDDVQVLRRGEATGPLLGGTLTQLVASLGTPYAFDPPPGAVLFLEDVNERPYRVDRMLTQLQFAGILNRAAALVFGEMRGCDEPGGGVTARVTIEQCTASFDGPVLYGVPSGHTTGPCWTLPLGGRVRVVAGGVGELIAEEAAVG